MDNLGNTCYMNSVMQVLFTVPSFIEDYVNKAEETFANASFDNPESNFQLQMTKLGNALWSGDYSKNAEEEFGIKPVMFKNLIGIVIRLVEFSSGGTKFERFLPKNQHSGRKLFSFENWCNEDVKIDIIKKCQQHKMCS